MKYRREDEDALPQGFFEASADEQAEYWTTRAQDQLDRYDAQQARQKAARRKSERHYAEVMADIHRTNESLKACQHRHTRRVVFEATEDDHGVALDGEVQEQCRDCKAMLHGVLA